MTDRTENDNRALEELRLGNDQALNRIMKRWQRPLGAFAMRYVHSDSDAEDLVIETFVRLYQNRKRLRRKTNLSAWLFTTLSRLCLNHLRWRKRHPSVAGDDPSTEGMGRKPLSEPWGTEPAHPADFLEDAERLEVLREVIDQLPHESKTMLLLHYFEQMPLRDIGAIVGRSEKSVETRLYRLRRQLRTRLEPQLAEPQGPRALPQPVE